MNRVNRVRSKDRRTKASQVRPRFTGVTREAPSIELVAPFRGVIETELERLKGRMLRELLAEAPSGLLHAPLRKATNEAAALAWTTSFPLLLLPELVHEKAESARRYARRQAALRRRSLPSAMRPSAPADAS